MASDVMCCFCTGWLPEHKSVQLVVSPKIDSGESQTLYCHSRCLTENLAASVPKHPFLLDDSGAENMTGTEDETGEN